MSDRITPRFLRSLGACEEQVTIFAKEWPRGAAINEKNIARAVKLHLDFGWLAQATLTATAWAEYARVKAPALAEYARVKATALAEYERVTAPAWAEYDRVTATAWAQLFAVKKNRRDKK